MSGFGLSGTGAVLIFPRLAFVTLANNLMVLSIRSMLTEFFCERWFEKRSDCSLDGSRRVLLSRVLVRALHARPGKVGIFIDDRRSKLTPRFEISQIGWWLLEVYFGLDASGFEAARKF